MKISRKFLALNVFFAFAIISVSFFVFLVVDYKYQKENIINELKNINNTISESIDIYLNLAIEEQLKLISEKNNIYINQIIDNFNKKLISEYTAKNLIKDFLRPQKIGKTGYAFIWNITRYPDVVILDLHPEIEGEDVAYVDFVQKGAKQKNGYLEYLWANPSDKEPRYKSMYLHYIPEFNWIIAYSTYKDEFYYLLNINRFRDLVFNMQNFGNGNSFILDFDGNAVLHQYEKGNMLHIKDIRGKQVFKLIVSQKEGVIEYYWKDYKKNNNYYRKIAYFSPLEKFNLIIVSTVFIKDAFKYYNKILFIILVIMAFLFIFITIATTKFTNLILSPFYLLQENLSNILRYSETNVSRLSEQLIIEGDKDEIVSFSYFIESLLKDLNEINLKLKNEYEEEKLLREEVESQKNFISQILDSLPFGICVVDFDSKIVNYNRYFYENYVNFKNIEQNELILGKDVDDILIFKENVKFKLIKYKPNFDNNHQIKNELMGESFFSCIVEKLKTNPYQLELNVEIFFKTKNNHNKSILKILAIPFLDKNTLRYVIFRIEDITEESKKIEKDIEFQKMQSINNLIRGLSHDINNYIGAVKGGTNILYNQIEEDKKTIDSLMKYLDQKDNHLDFDKIKNLVSLLRANITTEYLADLDIISQAINKASNLLQKFNIVSRKKEEEFTIIDLKEVLNRIIIILKSSFEKNINIKFLSNEDQYYFINGIEEQIESLLMNLIINSYHALLYDENTEKKDKNINIKLTKILLESKSYVRIIIEDNGIGIDDELKHKIFEPFFTTKPKEKGSGLGLYIVRQIVDNHKGNIFFESKKNEGTVFYVDLPEFIEPRKDVDDIIKKEKDKETNKESKNVECFLNKSVNLLIIDDDDGFRYFIKKGLKKYGFHILEASNGYEAIEIYKNKKNFIDIVLLDLEMPIMDGKETLKELKKIDPDIKIIMISGYIEDERILECKKTNIIDDFVQKPFDLFLILNKINLILNK